MAARADPSASVVSVAIAGRRPLSHGLCGSLLEAGNARLWQLKRGSCPAWMRVWRRCRVAGWCQETQWEIPGDNNLILQVQRKDKGRICPFGIAWKTTSAYDRRLPQTGCCVCSACPKGRVTSAWLLTADVLLQRRHKRRGLELCCSGKSIPCAHAGSGRCAMGWPHGAAEPARTCV